MSRRLTDQERLWRSVPESQVLKAVLDYLGSYGAYAWRNNTGAMSGEHKGKRWFVKYSETGAADVFCILNGRFIAVETKTELGKQSDDQRQWQQLVEAVGGVYLICRPSSWQETIDAAIGVLAEASEEGTQ